MACESAAAYYGLWALYGRMGRPPVRRVVTNSVTVGYRRRRSLGCVERTTETLARRIVAEETVLDKEEVGGAEAAVGTIQIE